MKIFIYLFSMFVLCTTIIHASENFSIVEKEEKLRVMNEHLAFDKVNPETNVNLMIVGMVEHSDNSVAINEIRYMKPYLENCEKLYEYTMSKLQSINTVSNSLVNSLYEYRNLECDNINI